MDSRKPATIRHHSDDDNIRVYLPMDICKSSILRRLADVISHYGPATESNELDFSYDVSSLISQIEMTRSQSWLTIALPMLTVMRTMMLTTARTKAIPKSTVSR